MLIQLALFDDVHFDVDVLNTSQEKKVPALQRYSGGILVELWYYTGNQPEQMGPLEFHWESTGILVNLDKLFVHHCDSYIYYLDNFFIKLYHISW